MLLPSLQPRFSRLSAHLLVELAENPSSVAQKLAELKQLFPSADIFRIINRRSAWTALARACCSPCST